MDYVPSNEFMASPTSMQPPPKPRKKAPTLRDTDWDPHQVLITELYTSGKTLKDVMAIVKAETGFHAGLRQYKSRISKWNLDKNTKTKEMKSIVKKRQMRKIIEDDKAELMFSVRGNEVDSTKIDRWMREHNVDEDELYSPSSLASTPSAIECRTNTQPSTPTMRSLTPTLVSRVISEPLLYHHPFDDYASTKKALQGEIWNLWFKFVENLRILDLSQAERVHELKKCGTLSDLYIERGIRHGYNITTSWGPFGLFSVFCRFPWDDVQLLSQLFDYFLSIGCDIEARDAWGDTLLLRACRYYTVGSSVYISQLIQYGADVSVKSLRGQGALDLALGPVPWTLSLWSEEHLRQQLLGKLGLLLEAGCDPRIKHRFSQDDVGLMLQCWLKALDTEKKRRSLLPPQETQHLPPLP
ncbi:hypothetical protein HBI56_063740 [Parastagonospora nodorum]|nr:hypothetical protein HBH52_201690 [Parastagonospora nodorum]KAH4105945.1 hypothetical protein HBH46_073150 [Parastagonospora nodorum]KAH4895845.1 hypothetical protein HBI80_213550 [Parastagonospora nodorum]KAH5298945.1 hypothetical protein HBI50_216530 [Parastagonospora nodorum]KAH5604241.1 hypothetical protein HBI45_113730 [Parastagonospora nodorum]